jgi:hypothetical protein
MSEPPKLYRLADTDWSDHYAAIGEFVVSFEKISTALRFQYACVMQLDGLQTWALATNLLNIPSIGPEALAVAFRAAVTQVTDDQDVRARADRIVKEAKELAELRNQIVHGEWLIGANVVVISDTPELPARQGIKRKPSKTGEKVTEQPTAEELRALSARCNEATKEIAAIFGEVIQAYVKAGKIPVAQPSDSQSQAD